MREIKIKIDCKELHCGSCPFIRSGFIKDRNIQWFLCDLYFADLVKDADGLVRSSHCITAEVGSD